MRTVLHSLGACFILAGIGGCAVAPETWTDGSTEDPPAGEGEVGEARQSLDPNDWTIGGNTLTTTGVFGGISGNFAIDFRVNNARALRLAPASTPNITGGHSANVVTSGAVGTTITGGGAAGGNANKVTDSFGFVGGGTANRAGDNAGTVSDRQYAAVVAGRGNAASGSSAFIGAGESNVAGALDSMIGSGSFNSIAAAANYSAIAGGDQNSITTDHGTIGGGMVNQVTAAGGFGTVGGGQGNVASGTAPTIGGGVNNNASASYPTIAGGWTNTATAYGAVGGGAENKANSAAGYATVAGGNKNTASGAYSALGGGYSQTAGGDYSVIAGGYANSASGPLAAILGGAVNQASGVYANVLGGVSNVASGGFTIAAGFGAQATHDGCFVWNDFAAGNANVPLACSAANQWVVRASGGTYFMSNTDPLTPTGVVLAANGGSWSSLSDRNAKKAIVAVKPDDVLQRLAKLPLYTWSYKGEQDGIRHMGPMAQDFRAAFTLGDSERHITTVDADGVALAAIQGLNAKIIDLKTENERLAQQNRDFEKRLERLEGGRPAALASMTPFGSLGFAAVALGIAGAFFVRPRRRA